MKVMIVNKPSVCSQTNLFPYEAQTRKHSKTYVTSEATTYGNKLGRLYLFDIGNVLIGWNQARLLDLVFDKTGTPDTPETRLLFKQWNDLWDAGSQRVLAQKQKQTHPDLAAAIDAYCDNWEVSLDPVIEGSFDVVEAIKKTGARLYTASNWGSDTFAIARPRMPRLDLFDEVYISGETGLCKPHAAFWQDMMRRFSFEAHEALFIDDREDNIRAAAALGLQTHLFQTPEKLRQAIGLSL